MDLVLGRLAQTGFTSLLPLLGAFKIADDSIAKPIPGFVLYNVSDGILATDITGWFARWLLCQNVTFNSTTLTISVKINGLCKPRHGWLSGRHLLQYVAGIVTMGPLLVIFILTGDWWGFANWAAMAISVIVRRIVISQNLTALDIASSKADARSKEPVKVFLTLPTGNAVTIRVPRGIVLDCLLTTPRPPNSRLYSTIRAVGWMGFGVHMVCLGMTSLLNQILAITLLLIATVLVAQRVDDKDTYIGHQLEIRREDIKGPDFRAAAMARLELSTAQENTMLAWNLFPQKSNTDWWQKYRVCQASPHGVAFKNWDRVLATPFVSTTS